MNHMNVSQGKALPSILDHDTNVLTVFRLHVLRYRNRVAHDAIRVSREGGNLLLSGTVN